MQQAFPWRSLLDAGALLAFGSDWPLMSADPLWGLAVAITRQDQDGHPAVGWVAHQRLTVQEAVAAYTEGSAMIVGQEAELGRLAPGFLGDLVVLQPGVDLHQPETLWRGERLQYVIVAGHVRHTSDANGVPARSRREDGK